MDKSSLDQFWDVVTSPFYDPPSNYEEMLALDFKHSRVGLGELWYHSKRRQELLDEMREKMASERRAEAVVPDTFLRDIARDGDRVPVVAYLEDGQPGTVVGEATLKKVEEGVAATIDFVSIDGQYAEQILKSGTNAFSIGLAPPAIDAMNQQPARPPRWQRRSKSGKKE